MAVAISPDLAMRSRSAFARGRYIELAEQAAGTPASETQLRATLQHCVAWLELFYISALTWEFIHQHELRSLDQLRSQLIELDLHIRSAFPDLDAAIQEIGSVLGELPAPPAELWQDWSEIEWPQMVRSFDAIAVECPIERLEAIGHKLDAPRLSHRARSAYDALRAFVQRHDPQRAAAMRIVGEQYQRGNLSLRDAARLLGMSSTDAVFELEHDGFSRPLSAIRLTEPDREAAYQRLRQWRLERAGKPAADPETVERDVIASERIKGVDARAWIRRR